MRREHAGALASRRRRYGLAGVSGKPLAILYVGAKEGTSLQRAETLAELGHEVVHLASGIPPLTA